MKISELAKATKVPAKTIRYYEQVGLIARANRNDNGYRQYQSIDTETLIFIRRCRELNIAIDDIKRIIEVRQNPQASCSFVDEIISQQLTRIKQTQKELAMLEASLTSLATSCVNNKIEDCGILLKLDAN